ncbi:MAG: YkgJ family cysteine cluster protein [Bacteroidota bacterium]|nr:YkgJ family cysteine cluster protein [Bacteroidota bacterium]
MAALAGEREEENERFNTFLKNQPQDTIDEWVTNLNRTVETQIDCTNCGNCCKSLMINVTETEANSLAEHFQQSRNDFDAQHIEKGSNGLMIMNTIPCHFLTDNKCTVYTHRFAGCREFPGLHLPGFTKRLFSVFMHYDRCPIIFNVVEELKIKTGFK